MRLPALTSAALAATLVAAVAGPASAVEAEQGAGTSESVLTMFSLGAGGQTVEAGVLSLLADTVGGQPLAKAVVTPVRAGGASYGETVVTGGDAPTSVPGVSSAAVVPALAGLVSASTPQFGASASTGVGTATSQAGAESLGSLSLLGLPVDVAGTVGSISKVTGAGSEGTQTVEIADLALPTLADILGQLGLDLSALPVEVLYELLDRLELVTTTVAELNAELDAALAQLQTQITAAEAEVDKQLAAVDAAQKDLTAKTSALAPLEQTLLQKNQAVTAARAARDAAVAEVNRIAAEADVATKQALYNTLLAEYNPADPLTQALLKPALDAAKASLDAALALVTSAQKAVTDATTALTNAETAAQLAQAAVDAARAAVVLAQQALDTALDLLATARQLLVDVLSQVTREVEALRAAVVAVLDGTPLVSLDAVSVVTRTAVTSAASGGQTAEVVGGEISGLRVLGTDVLSDVLNGSSSVELLDLTAETLTQVNGLIGTLTGALSDVLSTVPLFPTLDIPAPQVTLLEKTTSTDVVDGFGTAAASVTLLSIDLPAITLPADLALPGAADLPVFDALAGGVGVKASAIGDLTSTPLSVTVAQLGPQTQFRPGVDAAAPGTGTPGTGTPGTGGPGTVLNPAPVRELPRTGASTLLAGAALVLLGGAFALRRRYEGVAEGVAAE